MQQRFQGVGPRQSWGAVSAIQDHAGGRRPPWRRVGPEIRTVGLGGLTRVEKGAGDTGEIDGFLGRTVRGAK